MTSSRNTPNFPFIYGLLFAVQYFLKKFLMQQSRYTLPTCTMSSAVVTPLLSNN